MKTLKNLLPVAVVAIVLIAMACKKKTVTALKSALLNNYSISQAGIYPEGIDYDTKNNSFIFGSVHKGLVLSLSADGKTLKTIVNDPKLVAVLGVYTDETRNRYIVASGDIGASEKSGANGSTAGSVAYVGIYNTDGTLIKGVDLKGLTPNAGALPNDIAVDKDGNIYVTDSFSPVIYKIDATYNASLFTTNTGLFTPAAGSFGLNGIVYHPDGYFIFAKTNDNKLFKINASNPAEVTEISGLNGAIKTPDGLELTADNKLVVVENGLADGKVFLLSSSDKFQSASITGQQAIGKADFPTTAVTVSKEGTFVLNSKLGALLGGDKTQSNFGINKVNFK